MNIILILQERKTRLWDVTLTMCKELESEDGSIS